jgi:hypothetical protein
MKQGGGWRVVWLSVTLYGAMRFSADAAIALEKNEQVERWVCAILAGILIAAFLKIARLVN